MVRARSATMPSYNFPLMMPKLIELLRPLPERIWTSSLRQSQPFVVGLTRCFLAKAVLQCQAVVLLYDQQLIVVGEPIIRSLIETLVHLRFVYLGFCETASARVESELARLPPADDCELRACLYAAARLDEVVDRNPMPEQTDEKTAEQIQMMRTQRDEAFKRIGQAWISIIRRERQLGWKPGRHYGLRTLSDLVQACGLGDKSEIYGALSEDVHARNALKFFPFDEGVYPYGLGEEVADWKERLLGLAASVLIAVLAEVDQHFQCDLRKRMDAIVAERTVCDGGQGTGILAGLDSK